MLTPKELRARRKTRTRYQIKQKSAGRLRLSVHRTGMNIYAQIIDDAKGETLVAISTMDKDLRHKLKTGADCAAAAAVGKRLAELAKEKNIKEVAFDRGCFLYHGRVKALAEAAREAGLDF